MADVPIEIISLNDISEHIPEPAETAGSSVEIAAQKALGYIEHIDDTMIVLTQDDSIEFEGVKDEDKPGPFVKEPVQKKYGTFTDENAIHYYTDLAKKYGGVIPMVWHYGNAIAYKATTDRRRITIMASSSELHARLVDTPRKPELAAGYPLSSIVQINIDGKWVYRTDLSEALRVKADDDLKASILSLLKEVL